MHEEDGSVTIRDDLDALLQARQSNNGVLTRFKALDEFMFYVILRRFTIFMPLRFYLETSEIHWGSTQTEPTS